LINGVIITRVIARVDYIADMIDMRRAARNGDIRPDRAEKPDISLFIEEKVAQAKLATPRSVEARVSD